MLKKTVTITTVLLFFLCGCCNPRPDYPVERLLMATVMVRSGGESPSYGTGVVVRCGRDRYVWTCAHNLNEPSGGKLEDVRLIQESFRGGRKVGEETSVGKVVRYSKSEDVALIKVLRARWPSAYAVMASRGEIPRPGDRVWHVGSMCGPRGCNSVSEGVVAAVGRERQNGGDKEGGLLYDQMSVVAQPGSSGGGVFCKRTGRCIGLLAEYLGPKLGGAFTPSSFCSVPTRRLRGFAEATNCLWAVDGAEPPGEVAVVICD
jgi:S1-C subfamily serine protease